MLSLSVTLKTPHASILDSPVFSRKSPLSHVIIKKCTLDYITWIFNELYISYYNQLVLYLILSCIAKSNGTCTLTQGEISAAFEEVISALFINDPFIRFDCVMLCICK